MLSKLRLISHSDSSPSSHLLSTPLNAVVGHVAECYRPVAKLSGSRQMESTLDNGSKRIPCVFFWLKEENTPFYTPYPTVLGLTHCERPRAGANRYRSIKPNECWSPPPPQSSKGRSSAEKSQLTGAIKQEGADQIGCVCVSSSR